MERVAPMIAEAVGYGAAGLRHLPFLEERTALVEARGAAGLLGAPDEWWIEFGAIGTPDDAVAHLEALANAGATRVAIFFPPDRERWDSQLDMLGREVLPACGFSPARVVSAEAP